MAGAEGTSRQQLKSSLILCTSWGISSQADKQKPDQTWSIAHTGYLQLRTSSGMQEGLDHPFEDKQTWSCDRWGAQYG